MRIIVKGLKGFEIYPENKAYLEEKFRKLEKFVKEPAVLEFAFDHSHSSRANLDKQIHLTFTQAGMKNPEHIEEISPHFPETIDKLYERFEKFLQRSHEKEIDKEQGRGV